MAARSLSSRLVLVLTAVSTLLWIAASMLATAIVWHELYETFDSAQMQTARRLLPLAVHDLFETGEDDREDGEESLTVGDHDEYLTYQIRNAAGAVLLRSEDAPSKGFGAPLKVGFADLGDYRIYTDATEGNRVFIQVAEPLSHRWRAVFESTLATLVPLGLLVPLSILLTYIIVRQTMQPLIDLAAVISERGRGNLSPTDLADLPEEIAPIAAATDQLLARIRKALEAERAFAAYSAHELRSPLASALSQLQRLRSELTEPSHRERLVRVEGSLKRLSSLAEKLLELARAEAGMALAQSRVDLRPAFDAIVRDAMRRPQASGRFRDLVPATAPIEGRIDPDAFGIVIGNLVDNALIHGDLDQPVEIIMPRASELAVRSHGPVVEPAALERLRLRFARGDTTAKGSGLGLAIADTIMRQVGGRLVLRSPAAGWTDGFEAVIALPMVEQPAAGARPQSRRPPRRSEKAAQ